MQMCHAQCHAIHSLCVVWLCWCRKQVAGQIPAHLASQMKPQQWTETVGQCFQEVEELSAVEAKKKYIGNPPLAQTCPCPSHCLLSTSCLLPCLFCRCCQLPPALWVTVLPCHGGENGCMHNLLTSLMHMHLLLVCLSSLSRVWPTPSSHPRLSLQSTRTVFSSWMSKQR